MKRMHDETIFRLEKIISTIKSKNGMVEPKDLYPIYDGAPSLVISQFREYTGLTLYRYIIKVRMEYVKANIALNPDLLFKNLAHNLKFKDPNQMSKEFKRHFGYTLSAYRSMIRGRLKQDA